MYILKGFTVSYIYIYTNICVYISLNFTLYFNLQGWETTAPCEYYFGKKICKAEYFVT